MMGVSFGELGTTMLNDMPCSPLPSTEIKYKDNHFKPDSCITSHSKRSSSRREVHSWVTDQCLKIACITIGNTCKWWVGCKTSLITNVMIGCVGNYVQEKEGENKWKDCNDRDLKEYNAPYAYKSLYLNKKHMLTLRW